MTAENDEIILYDLACIKNVCFSPIVWRIRCMLNYKCIPYKTIFLEFPDIETTLKELGVTLPEDVSKYTVPTIQHVPTKKYIMDSTSIAKFIELTYPEPSVPLTSILGREIEISARAVIGKVIARSMMPREIQILAPRAQEYFRRTREAVLGCRLEDLLDPEKEEQNWNTQSERIREVGRLMQTNKSQGPFVLGTRPSYTDFFVAGALQSARIVDEGIFRRINSFPGYAEIYAACLPYMEKKD